MEEADHIAQSLLSLAFQLQCEAFLGLLEHLQPELLLLEAKTCFELRMSFEYLLGPEFENFTEDVQFGGIYCQIG